MWVLIVVGVIVGGGFLAWTPFCECGHRGCWHDPDDVNGAGLGCFKCECRRFKRRDK